MLTGARRGTAAVLAALALTAAAPPAHAADPGAATGCIGGADLVTGCSNGTVTVVVVVDGRRVETTLADGAEAVVCTFAAPKGEAAEVPCDDSDLGWWSGEQQCYVQQRNPQPPAGDPLWQGHTTGTIYDCRRLDGEPSAPFWAEDPPVNPAQVRQLAAEAVQTLELTAIGVGMAPTPTSIKADSIGIVGLPNWLWVANPSPRTWGPTTGTATDAGLTVTVTAQVDRVTWDMGDDTAPIVCTTPGTPYNPSYQAEPSPDCGHTPGYQHQGDYQITAESHWAIAYTSNVGVQGTLGMNLTRQATLRVGELQTVVVKG